MEIKYLNTIPTVEDYNKLRTSVGWGKKDKNIAAEAFKNTIYVVCAFDENKLIGMGRIIGDKTIFLHVHDVMVNPNYQGKKIGSTIVLNLIEYVDKIKINNPELNVYLGSTKGKENFYEKFGFIKRPNDNLGAGMILKK